MKLEQETLEAELIPDGTVAAFEIVAAEEGPSKGGKTMIKLTVIVRDPASDRQQRIYYYLVAGSLERIYNAASALGLRAQYDAGELNAGDFLRKKGYARIGIERHPTNEFPPRNRILSFVVPPPAVASVGVA